VALVTSAETEPVALLYRDHNQWLRGWLRKKLGCADRASDLAHDTFVRVLSNRSVAGDIREPKAFLTTIAQRVLSNHWRREALEKAWLDALAQLPEPFALSPEDRAILLETLVELDRILDALPAKVRKAFLMYQLDGATHTEVANALGVSVITAKRYTMRGLQQCYFADLPAHA
jgi:RNA polymerase sigma-19 factor, ECF subfamily